MTVTGLFLWPEHRPLSKATWMNDFQVAVAYRFGGTAPQAASP